MPLYRMTCPSCRKSTDVLAKVADRPDELPCSCGATMVRPIGLPARTRGMWGGVDTAHFNRGLGCHVSSHAEADRIARERGLVRLNNFDKYHVEDTVESSGNKWKQEADDSRVYTEKLSSGMGHEQAIAETFPVSKLQERGMLDPAIKGD
jgi:hypothetical protein